MTAVARVAQYNFPAALQSSVPTAAESHERADQRRPRHGQRTRPVSVADRRPGAPASYRVNLVLAGESGAGGVRPQCAVRYDRRHSLSVVWNWRAGDRMGSGRHRARRIGISVDTAVGRTRRQPPRGVCAAAVAAGAEPLRARGRAWRRRGAQLREHADVCPPRSPRHLPSAPGASGRWQLLCGGPQRAEPATTTSADECDHRERRYGFTQPEGRTRWRLPPHRDVRPARQVPVASRGPRPFTIPSWLHSSRRAELLRERAAALARFAQWEADNPVRYSPGAALQGVGALYDLLPGASNGARPCIHLALWRYTRC